jgi:transposase
MASVALFVGLDYHADEVQVCALDQDGRVVLNRKCANSAAKIQAAVDARGQVRRAAIESCCGAANLADELIMRGNWPVQLAHPGFVARMKKSPDKTDRQDAQLLADLARVDYLPQVWLAPEDVRQLRRLVRFRQQLVDARRNVKLRIRALAREKRLKCDLPATPWTKGWIAWLRGEPSWSEDDRWILDQQFERLAQLSAQITATEKRLNERVDNDPLVKKLLSLDGVGLITAVTIRAEIGRFDRFQNGKQLARFCGLSPRNVSSGQRQADAGLIRAGNPQLRAVLIELAQRLMWTGGKDGPSRWQTLGHHLQSRGKPRNVVVAAVANRWIRWLFHEAQRPLAPAEAQAATETNAAAAPKTAPDDLRSGSTKGGPPLPSSPPPRPTPAGRVRPRRR